MRGAWARFSGGRATLGARRRSLMVALLLVAQTLAGLAGAAAEAADAVGDVRIVARGMHWAYSITSGPDGNLWSTNHASDTIWRITPAGTTTPFTDDTIRGPMGITAGPDGNLWFTSSENDSIGRISPGGEITSFAGDGINHPIAITVGPDGNLWFANRDGGSIGRLTPDGTLSIFPDAHIITPVSITAGPDGNIWFTSMTNSRIGRITPGGEVTTFAHPNLFMPTDITAGPDGNLWFTAGIVGRITPEGAFTFFPGSVAGHGITEGPDGNLWYTTDLFSSGAIGRITPDGTVTTFGGVGISDPRAITAGPDGNLWFTNIGNHSVGRITPSGAVSSFTGTGISYVAGFTAGPDGKLWFTNSGNGTVGSMTTAGEVFNHSHAGLIKPQDMVAGPDGNLWFTNTGAQSRVDSIGRITPAGQVTLFTGGVDHPGAIAVGPDGALWFANLGRMTIGRITTAGQLSFFSGPGINNPHGLAGGADGNVWFTNRWGHSIGRITPAGAITTFTAPGVQGPEAITAGPDGNLWFTNVDNDSIGRISPTGQITTFTDPSIDNPIDIAAAPDGKLWFANIGSDSIGVITPAGAVSAITGVDGPKHLTVGPDGNMWFAGQANIIGFVRTGHPGVATDVTAIAADAQALVSWTAPVADGGTPITGYTVTASPGGRSCTWTSGPLTCTVTGLDNGAAYSFTVTATNATGPGPASVSSPQIRPEPDPVRFHSLSPVRLLDTRVPGPQAGPWLAGTVRDVLVAGAGVVPAAARAVVLNATVTGTTANSYLTIWPKGQPQPQASSLNWSAGQTIPNAVTVRIGAGGMVSVFNAIGSADVVFDVVGYYAGGPGDGYTPLAPARILDSRPTGQTPGYQTPWQPGQTREVTVVGAGGVPEGATSVAVNVTVTGTTASGYLTVWPAGQPMPLASSLNWVPSQTIANAVTSKVGAGGQISVFNAAGSVDVIVDVVGYFATGTGSPFHPLPPARIQDSRPGPLQVGPFGTPWTENETRSVKVAAMGGAPPGANAVLVNLTATGTSDHSYLTIWPGNQRVPLTSSLNWTPGQTIANSVTATPDPSTDFVNVRNAAGNVHVIMDTAGWYG